MRAFDRFSQPVDKTRRDSLPSGQVVVKYGRRFFFFSFFFLPAYIAKNEITITNSAPKSQFNPAIRMHRNSRGQFFPHNSNRISRIDRSVHAACFPLHFYPIRARTAS